VIEVDPQSGEAGCCEEARRDFFVDLTDEESDAVMNMLSAYQPLTPVLSPAAKLGASKLVIALLRMKLSRSPSEELSSLLDILEAQLSNSTQNPV
jgi:hypothetical protein